MQSEIIAAQHNSEHSQGALCRCCPLRASESRQLMALAALWSTWCCSAFSVEPPFRAPVGCAITRPQMPSQCCGRRLKSIKHSMHLTERCWLSVKCHRAVYLIPLVEASHGDKASRPHGAHWCCSPGRAVNNRIKAKQGALACSVTMTETSSCLEDG